MLLFRDPSNALTVARRHTATLALIATGSIAAAVPLWIAADGPDGRDAFYVALAIEFVIWGVIDLGFAVHGLPSLLRMSAEEGGAIETMQSRTLAALGISCRLNVVYLAVGVALTAWGYHAWSATLVGHGVGVLVQGGMLTLLDASFIHGLRSTPVPSPGTPGEGAR